MSAKDLLTLYFDGSPTDKLTISNFANMPTYSSNSNLNLNLLIL